MILTCPACTTRYLVDPAALGSGGRMVRCAKCGHTWMQAPPDDMPKPVEAEPAATAEAAESAEGAPARRARAAFRPPQKPSRGAAVGWGMLVAVVLAVIVGGAQFRTRIVEAWPPAARLYTAVGLDVEVLGAGLKLSNFTISPGEGAGGRLLVIEGEIANISDEARDIPLLRGALITERQSELKHWTFSAGRDQLLPGEVITFRTEVSDPPAGAAGISITFTDAPEDTPATAEEGG